jgi:zinc transport system permease protein
MFDFIALPFMQRAMIAGILAGFLGSYYGVFVVQRKMSFLGSGLAHAAFGGVALGLLLETEPLITALPFTILASLLITYVKENTELSIDTSIGILFAVSVALGIIFISLNTRYTSDAFSYLFGSILTVTMHDLYLSGGLAVLTVFTFYKCWSRWAYATFDSELARTDRHKVSQYNYLLSILISITIVISIKLVGIILIAAFLVIPAAASRLISRSFSSMTFIAIIIGVISTILGLPASFWLDLPSGATIILLQALIFLVAFLISKLQK